MIAKFICPHCKGILNVNNQIIFTVKHASKVGLITISPHLGDYTIWHHPDFQMNEGEKFNFYCPVCMADLSVKGSENLASVVMEEEGKQYNVVFSKIKGEHCTYKIAEGTILGAYGEHSSQYLDFVSASLLK